MLLNSVVPCNLTTEQKKEIGDVLVQARKIVERVSTEAFGEFAIREFRRVLPTGKLNKYLSDSDRIILKKVQAVEEIVLKGFFKMVQRLVLRAVYAGVPGEVDDLTQEGLELIMLSMMGYNGKYDLSTYFWYVVKRHFQDLAKRHRRHESKECSIGERDVPAREEAEEITYDGYNMRLLKYAMTCVQLTELEETVLELVMEGRKDAYAEAARRVINPNTKKPYSRMRAQMAHKLAREKVAAVYNSLLIRAA